MRVVYSPFDALKMAESNPDKKVIFFAAGFETTSPAVAATLGRAIEARMDNFYIFSVHKTIPGAMRLSSIRQRLKSTASSAPDT